MNIIPKPLLNDLSSFKRGKVKFINKENQFGFIVDGSGRNLFVHLNWIKYPEIEIDENAYNIVLYSLNDALPMEQPVLYREVVGVKGLEAHYVVDELQVQFLRHDLRRQYEIACRIWATLTMYRATLVKNCLRPRAEKGGHYGWKDVGVRKILLFEGNNLAALRDNINESTVQIALTQPGTNILYEMYVEGSWTECECPIC